MSGTGSPENTQGSAVQTPWPSNDEARSTSTTFVTWADRASVTAPAMAVFNAPSTTWAAV